MGQPVVNGMTYNLRSFLSPTHWHIAHEPQPWSQQGISLNLIRDGCTLRGRLMSHNSKVGQKVPDPVSASVASPIAAPVVGGAPSRVTCPAPGCGFCSLRLGLETVNLF